MARRVTPTELDTVPEADSPADTHAGHVHVRVTETTEQTGKARYGAERGLTGTALDKAWAAAPDGLRAYYTA